jgi:hypothetical protein
VKFDAFIAIPLLSQPGKRSGKLQIQTVQTPGIRSIVAPEGQRSASVGQAFEDLFVEAFIAEAAVE